jgi:hypothetical protein
MDGCHLSAVEGSLMLWQNKLIKLSIRKQFRCTPNRQERKQRMLSLPRIACASLPKWEPSLHIPACQAPTKYF